MENFIETFNAMSVICNWSTYHGTHCRRTIEQPTKGKKVTLCPLHKELINDFKRVDKDEGHFCESSKKIKFVPRSYKHLRYQLDKMNNKSYNLDVIIQGTVGELTEEADISNEEYIQVLSDDVKYYYNPDSKTKKHAKNLTIVLKHFCPNDADVYARGEYYCQECYKKLKNVPKYSVVPFKTA